MLEDNPAKRFLEDEKVFEYCFNLFIREWYYYAKIDIKDDNVRGILGEETYSELASIKVSRKKWRKSLWTKICATAMSDKEKKKAQSKSFGAHFGFIVGGLVSSLTYLLNQFEDEEVRDQLELTAEEMHEFQSELDQIQEMVVKNQTPEKDTLNEYFFKGKGRYSNGGYLFNATKATTRHYIMLMLGPLLEEMRSVDKMYDHLNGLLGNDLQMTRQSFKDFCKVIGLQGKRYKRLRSN